MILLATPTALVLGVAIYNYVSSKKKKPTLSERLSFKRRKTAVSAGNDAKDFTARNTGDEHPIHNNTDEDNTALHGVEKGNVNKEKKLRQAAGGVQEETKGDKQQNADCLAALRESEEGLTRRLGKQRAQTEATVQHMLQDPLAQKAQSDNEMKSLREEPVLQGQRPPRTEKKAEGSQTRSDEVLTLRKELELKRQQEAELRKQFQAEEEKHQGERAKWLLQAQVWRKNAAAHYDAMAVKAKQLEKEKANAIEAANAMTDKCVNLTTQHMELEGKFEAVKKHYELTKQDRIRVEGEYQRKLERAASQLDHMQNLLAVRTKELKGAQVFLSTADQFSGADLIKGVEQLNSEILQLAASVADEVVGKERVVGGRAGEDARNLLGRRLADLLTSPTSHDVHQIVIQTAFQTALVAHVIWILSAWFFDGQEGEDILGNLHKRIRNSEAQAVAGRWRQLTRYHLQELMPKKLEDLQQGIMNTMAAIVVLAGYPLENVRPGMQQVGNRVYAIVKLAHSLNKKAGEGVTSSDLQFIKVKSDTPYDPTEMMTTFETGQPQKNARELIICTTDLGLVRSEKPPEVKGQFKTTVLLKPKVILYSEFEG